MTYGVPDRGAHAWTLDEAASRPLHPPRARARHQLLRHRQRLLRRHQRGDRRPRAGATSRRATRSCSPPRSTARCAAGPNGGGLSRKAIFAEIDASLRRLGTDYVDLYQIHRWDYGTPIEETLEALHDVVKAGKARYIGASSMYAWQFGKALLPRRAATAGRRFVVDAEPLQPALPRGGARDAAAVRGGGHRRDPVEPAGPRPAHPRAGTRPPSASETDDFGKTLYAAQADADRQVVERVAEVAAERAACRGRRSRWRGCSTSRRHRADRRRVKPRHLEDAVAALSVKL